MANTKQQSAKKDTRSTESKQRRPSVLGAEHRSVKVLERKLKLKIKKLPISYQVGYIGIRDGQAKSVIDVTSINGKRNKSINPQIRLKSWNSCLEYVQCNRIQAIFVIEWEDYIGTYHFIPGMTRPNFDIDFPDGVNEPVITIPNDEMNILIG